MIRFLIAYLVFMALLTLWAAWPLVAHSHPRELWPERACAGWYSRIDDRTGREITNPCWRNR